MCCCQHTCGKPNVNGENGYSWDGKHIGVHGVNPPDLDADDELLTDDPGRCGQLDSHAYHFRIVKCGGSFDLLVRHGGGDERFYIGTRPAVASLLAMDSNDRYWLLQLIYQTQERSARAAREQERKVWMKAAAEKRVKTRKNSRQGTVKVWIEPAA